MMVAMTYSDNCYNCGISEDGGDDPCVYGDDYGDGNDNYDDGGDDFIYLFI